MTELRETIEHFVAGCLEPALSEPGEELIRLSADNFDLDGSGGWLRLQAWSDHCNLVRRVIGIERQSRGKLLLRIERFGKRQGTLALLDLRRPAGEDAELRSGRLEFREQFRRFLRRQFPLYRIAELTTEADLEHSLSPAYPRALLQQGSMCWAAIGAPTDMFHAEHALTFGLIWLDYLRSRDTGRVIQGLILYLPSGQEKLTCLRLLFLDAAAACYQVFIYDAQGFEAPADLSDYGNIDTRLEPCRRRLPGHLDASIAEILTVRGVQAVNKPDGEISLRVRGMEFARTAGAELLYGITRRRALAAGNLNEVLALAENLARLRAPGATDRLNALYTANPEVWLESEVRAQLEQIDAQLLSDPAYGQVPAFAANDRGVLDVLAVDQRGRLAVLELKASQDIHLPLQALDYWIRVKWHLDRRDFGRHGYFPGVGLNLEAPRLLLVSPALDFHPANERVLRFFSPSIPVERVGVGLQWRRELKVVFRS
ncbi:MAG TPA: hypothetical protein VKX49_13050 [Bryobacteraceae bacterium]|nr:hypothetical protein [Bryobacteraceae bacterium]